MEPVLRRILLKKFRSVVAETIDFDNPTVLVGRNGAGKSNFVDALDFLADATTRSLQAVFDVRGGITAVRNRVAIHGAHGNLGLGVVFGSLGDDIAAARYAFEIKAAKNRGFEVLREQCIVDSHNGQIHWFDRRGTEYRSNLEGLSPALEPRSLALPLVGGDRRFSPVLKTLAAMRSYAIEPVKLRELQDPDDGLVLRSDGGNAASVLRSIKEQSPEDFERIGEHLATIVPNTRDVHPIRHGHKVSLEFTQEWAAAGGEPKHLKFESYSMSDGTLRALGLLTAIYQRPRPSVLVIEEPEATIHAGAIGPIVGLLRHASRHTQVVVTTHSPDVLDAEWIEAGHVRIVTWEEGATRIVPLSEGSREALREHLMTAGELLRSNALRGVRVSADVVPSVELFKDVRA